MSLPLVASTLAPTLMGTSMIQPKAQAPKWSLLFALIGIGAGTAGLTLASKGRLEEALKADVVSVIFDLMAIVKAVEVI